MTSDPYAGKVRLYGAVVDRLNRGVYAVAHRMVPTEAGSRVLDVGCGTGAQLERYGASECVISGVDLSPAMLEAARSRLGSNADLQLADASSLPYPDDEFDLVTCSIFLHELDPEVRGAVLTEVERVLKPTGRLVIVEFDSEPRKGLMANVRRSVSKVFERIAGRAHYANFVRFMAAGGVDGALSGHSLQVQEVRTFSGGDLAIYVVGPTPKRA